MTTDFDLVAIGDLVIDAFIRLKEAEVHCGLNKSKCEICLSFGDKIPYEKVSVLPAVGNSPNAAVAAARLGLKTALLSAIGDDQNGRDCLASLQKDGVAINLIKINREVKTNYHYVLWYADDRTILIKHEQFNYSLDNLGQPRWIYLSSLGENTLPLHDRIADHLEQNPEIKLAFQPGTFQIKFGLKSLERIYRRAEIFFCNLGEAKKILGSESSDPLHLCRGLATWGPKVVVITNGPRGAFAYSRKELWHMPIYPDPKLPYERTGAGDAFSSTVTAALALDLPLEEALCWGPINSMSVVQYVGAQKGLLTLPQLKTFLTQAPADYHPQKIN